MKQPNRLILTGAKCLVGLFLFCLITAAASVLFWLLYLLATISPAMPGAIGVGLIAGVMFGGCLWLTDWIDRAELNEGATDARST